MAGISQIFSFNLGFIYVTIKLQIINNLKPMHLQFYAKNIELTEQLKEHFQNKLINLKKYKGQLKLLQVRVDISRDRHHKKGGVFRVEINVNLPDKVLRVEETGADIYSALDVVAKKLERQARDAKELVVDKKRRTI